MNEATAYVIGLIEAEQKTCSDLSEHVAYCPARHMSEGKAAEIAATYGIRVVLL